MDYLLEITKVIDDACEKLGQSLAKLFLEYLEKNNLTIELVNDKLMLVKKPERK